MGVYMICKKCKIEMKVEVKSFDGGPYGDDLITSIIYTCLKCRCIKEKRQNEGGGHSGNYRTSDWQWE